MRSYENYEPSKRGQNTMGGFRKLENCLADSVAGSSASDISQLLQSDSGDRCHWWPEMV